MYLQLRTNVVVYSSAESLARIFSQRRPQCMNAVVSCENTCMHKKMYHDMQKSIMQMNYLTLVYLSSRSSNSLPAHRLQDNSPSTQTAYFRVCSVLYELMDCFPMRLEINYFLWSNARLVSLSLSASFNLQTSLPLEQNTVNLNRAVECGWLN